MGDTGRRPSESSLIDVPIINWASAERNGSGEHKIFSNEQDSLLAAGEGSSRSTQASTGTERSAQERLVRIHSEGHDYHKTDPRRRGHRRGQIDVVDVTPEYRKERYEKRKQLFACSLAALSGFADVLCHHSFGCYGNMMTGNTIRLLDALAAGDWATAAYPASLVPTYILGAALCTWLNFVDLTVLGLGGPSREAFAHLNPPRRLRSPQQISVLRVVAIVAVTLFLLGEFVVPFSTGELTTHRRWRLPFFSCAFGLINAATLNAVHLVTNAVTGHWITVGLGVADDLPVVLNRQSTPGVDTTSAPEELHPVQTPKPKPKKWTSSLSVAGSFIVLSQ